MLRVISKFCRVLSTTPTTLERKKFIIRESLKQKPTESTSPKSQNDEIKEILGLDQSIDKEGREILERFYSSPQPVQELSRFNRRVFDKEEMPAVKPWLAMNIESKEMKGITEEESFVKNSMINLKKTRIKDPHSIPIVEQVIVPELTSLQKLAAHINLLIESNKLDEALTYLNTIAEKDPESLHPQLYGMVARHHSNNSNSDLAIKILEDMMALLKVLPDEMTYNTIVQNLCREFEYSKASDLINHMQSHNLIPDINSYEHLVDACAASLTTEDVRNLITDFESKQIQPTIRMINTLLLALDVEHDYQGAIQVYRQLKSRYNLEPNEMTLESILKIFLKCNKVNDSVMILEKLLHLNSTLVHAYAFKVFEICVRGRKYQDAVKLLSQMRKNDALENTVADLIQTYAEEWENTLRHLLTVNESTQTAIATSKYDFEAQTTPELLSSSDQESHKFLALHLYKQLLSYKINLTPTTIALLIRVYHKNSDLVSAIRCWSIHHSYSPTPNLQIIASLLHAIRELGQEKTTRVVLTLRETESWPLDKTSASHLLVLMSRYGLDKQLINLVIDMGACKDPIKFGIEEYAVVVSTMKSFGKEDGLKAFRGFAEECMPSIVEEYEDRLDKIRLKGNALIH